MRKKPQAYIVLFCIWLAVSLYFVFPFMLSLIIGVIFGSIIYPLYRRCDCFIKADQLRALIFSFVFTVFFLAPFVFIGIKSTSAALKAVSEMPNINWKNPDKDLTSMIMKHPVSQKISEATSFSRQQVNTMIQTSVEYARVYLTKFTTEILSSVPAFVMSFIIILGTIYFCLRDGPMVIEFLSDNPFFTRKDTQFIFTTFAEVSYSVVLASIFCAITQAVIFMIPALIFDMDSAILVGLFTFLASFIPNIGTAPVSFFMVTRAAIMNDWNAMIAYIVFGVIVAFSDNVVHALFVGRRVHVHPFIAFISALGGIITLGIYGLFIAPVVVLTLVKVYQHWNEDSIEIAKEKAEIHE